MLIIGVDTGGTFTDIIYQERTGQGVRWKVHKRLSTPSNPAEAVLAGLAEVAGDAAKGVVHGSTVATNAILERKGVRTALVTNDKFTDVLAIGRQNRGRLYDLAFRKEPPIIPEELRFGIPGRITSQGEEREPFDEAAAREFAGRIKALGAESVAVSLLFSFLRPEHEERMGAILAEAGLPVSLSHRILAEFREFERTSTTAINAYVGPKMERYIRFLMGRLGPQDQLRIMQSNGGSISAETAMSESVRTILSGPAGGAVGAFEMGRRAGFDKLITFDMGGTSTDVSLMDNGLSLTLETSISGYPVKTPMIDIHTVGAGGGSIASIDAGGSIRVGPESAGADPGPICYGKGTEITVTDANLFLGRLVPEHFLGGRMRLDAAKIEAAFDDMAAKVGLSPVELAEGILAVANTNMERAIRVISVERGHDPREFALLSFGGAGGLHAAHLARLLNMHTVLVPRNPGILSAVGMLMADVIKDYSRTVMLDAGKAARGDIEAAFAPLMERGRTELAAEGIAPGDVILERYLDMRYEGQSYELIVGFADNIVEAFHAQHERTYGYRNPGKPVQLVNVRLRARGAPVKPEFERLPLSGPEVDAAAILGERQVIFDGRAAPAKVYDREALRPGNEFSGPAIVVEYTSTIVVPPFARARVDEQANLVLTIAW